MSWEDFYRRRDVLDAAVTTVRDRSDARLTLTEVPGATAEFGDAAELAAALHYRWMLLLTARVDLALLETERSGGDRVEAVTAAWQRTAATEPALRRVLDANPVPEDAAARERRMLALAAGLAEAGDSAAEIDRIGAAFLGLVRSAPAPSARRNPLSGLLRKLALSA
ncbi:hypothetical protein [Allokutzneria oryzae]|uniref:Uncharacterized protein n=1 Tax=Allokutzneria oryzae TaxID=1378989 RepID=A0ABV5ZNE5_9PSEU